MPKSKNKPLILNTRKKRAKSTQLRALLCLLAALHSMARGQSVPTVESDKKISYGAIEKNSVKSYDEISSFG